MSFVHISVCMDHRFSLIYGKFFHTYLRQVEFVNRNQEHILFNQSIIPVEILTKEGRLTNSILLEYPGESCIPVFLSLSIVKIWHFCVKECSYLLQYPNMIVER